MFPFYNNFALPNEMSTIKRNFTYCFFDILKVIMNFFKKEMARCCKCSKPFIFSHIICFQLTGSFNR